MSEGDVLQQMLEDTPPTDDPLTPTAAAAPGAGQALAPAPVPVEAPESLVGPPAPTTSLPTSTTAPPAPSGPGSGRGRRRAHGTGRKQSLALRQPVTFAQKLEIINYYESQQRDINATIAKFYSELSHDAQASRKRQIYRWVKERQTIEQMCFKKATANQTRRRDKGTATTLTPQAEQELLQWITCWRQQQQQQDDSMSSIASSSLNSKQMLSTQAFRAKAMEIAAKYDVPEGSFQATWTWQQGFLKRHHLSS